MTLAAPAARALVMSPEWRMPPSAITGMPSSLAAAATFEIAVICDTPTPVTIRVVQIDPGPTPTFTASTPCSIRSAAASPVAMFPAMMSMS